MTTGSIGDIVVVVVVVVAAAVAVAIVAVECVITLGRQFTWFN